QAEDGIRDPLVTGVQTCALPISLNWRGRPLTSHEVVIQTIAATRTSRGLRVEAVLDPGRLPDRRGDQQATSGSSATAAARHARRSEERRVGKEGRATGAALHAEV